MKTISNVGAEYLNNFVFVTTFEKEITSGDGSTIFSSTQAIPSATAPSACDNVSVN